MGMEEYLKSVAGQLKNATPKEKNAVKSELRAHIYDHVADLVEAGWTHEDAMAAAVASMGDPEVTGEELNRQFPRLWLVISRIATVFLCISLLFLTLPLVYGVYNAGYSMEVRLWPEKFAVDYWKGTEKHPMDVRMNTANGDIVRIYSQCIAKNDGFILNKDATPYDGYVVRAAYVTYDKNPFKGTAYGVAYGISSIPEISSSDEWGSSLSNIFSSYHVGMGTILAPVTAGQETIGFAYESAGERFETEFTLDWSGVK